jgi:hypothetical protein
VSVAILSLSGLPAAGAEQATAALLDIDSGGPDRLERLLVLDDTALLSEHFDVYEKIDTAHRVEKLLCVTVGPRLGDGRRLELPGNLGGVQGSPVLWVSRPAGIDWKMTKALVANRHPGFTHTTLDRHPLIGLLSVEEMFDRVYQAFLSGVPHRVASPGLWLAGEDDEAATFAGALAVAIRRVCDPGTAGEAPFAELMPDRAGGARLTESGPLARYLGRVGEQDRAASRVLERLTGFGGLLRRGESEVRGHVAKVGEALTDLRDLVDQVLRDADVAGGVGDLTANQHSLIRNAGLEFGAEGAPSPAAGSAVYAAEQSAVYRVVAGAVHGGDPIPAVGERLIATEREVGRKGSAAYRQEVAARCPLALLAGLESAAQKPPRRGGRAEVRHELGLDGAVAAAKALADLIVGVANREWSPTAIASGELVRAKAALDGTSRALAGSVSEAAGSRGGTRAARRARLGESLVPLLRDLVIHVVAAELASPSASGPEALRMAKDRTAAMLAEWTGLVQAQGVTVQPSFASSSAQYAAHGIEDDVASTRDALLHPPRDEMWQLCAPADLRALDVDAPTLSIRFASRLTKETLRSIPGDEPVWTSSGSFAGVLRLVPLRAGVAVSSWGEGEPESPSTVLEQ